MWKLLVPILLLACTTDSPETKKVSLNLKETCKTKSIYKMKQPSTWQGYIETSTGTNQVLIEWKTDGFVLPCDQLTGDTISNLILYYQ